MYHIMEQWWLDTIIQLYKGKGPKDQFENLRNYVPKLFENIMLDLAKPKIVSGTSKFQKGAIPMHIAQEYLFTVKSVISLYIATIWH